MNTEVVGIEGSVPDRAIVVWGAAALSDGRRVFNSHTGASISHKDADRLLDEGHLYLFDGPILIPSEFRNEPLIVVMVNREDPQSEPFIADTGRLGGLVGHRHTVLWHYYVFKDHGAYTTYAQLSADNVSKKILYSTDQNRELVRQALVLLPGSPVLNAIRVFLSNSASVHRLARASVRPATRITEFDLFLAALRSESDDYELKYQHGIAEGGGMDVDHALMTFRAIEAAHREVVPSIKRRYPFIQDVPAPRLRRLEAASAEFHFAPSIHGRSLGERVARYLSLHALEQGLRGKPPSYVMPSHSLSAALQRIAQPTPETRLSHKPLSETTLEEVIPVSTTNVSEEKSGILRVLGFVSGLTRDYRAELSIGPRRRFFVSTVDNGNGELPVGADAIKGDGRFLRAPCIFSLTREATEGVPERFNLVEMRLMRKGDSDVVTAYPSAVIPEAFKTDIEIAIRIDAAGTMISELGEFKRASRATLAAARTWLQAYASATKRHELTTHTVGGWLAPVEAPPATSLARVLVALNALGGEAAILEIVAEINRRFSLAVRVNNTRREVHFHEDLLEFHPDDDKVMRWTDLGAAYYQVYVAAGGRVRDE